MRLPELPVDVVPVPGALPAFHATIAADALPGLCRDALAQNARLVALWGSDETTRGSGYAVHVALAITSGLLWVSVPLSGERPAYPSVADVFPCAGRMQRAASDLLGIRATGAADERPWLRHGAWPEDAYPLRKAFEAATRFAREDDRYAFVRVEGEGVHEIPVGPVHAGTIEPGHFRFSVVG